MEVISYGLAIRIFSTAPIGTVLSLAGQTAPNGYLLCNSVWEVGGKQYKQ